MNAFVLAATALALRTPASGDRLVVHKAKREMIWYHGGREVQRFRIALGSAPIGPKRSKDDRKTPEGRYRLTHRNPKSRFRLSLAVGYPNAADAERAFRAGLITAPQRQAIVSASKRGKTPPWNTRLGGEVFLHGGGSLRDWTWGCIAVEDREIEVLYRALPLGTPIDIEP